MLLLEKGGGGNVSGFDGEEVAGGGGGERDGGGGATAEKWSSCPFHWRVMESWRKRFGIWLGFGVSAEVSAWEWKGVPIYILCVEEEKQKRSKKWVRVQVVIQFNTHTNEFGSVCY